MKNWITGAFAVITILGINEANGQSGFDDEYPGLWTPRGLSSFGQSRGKICNAFRPLVSASPYIEGVGTVTMIGVVCYADGYDGESGPQTHVWLEVRTSSDHALSSVEGENVVIHPSPVGSSDYAEIGILIDGVSHDRLHLRDFASIENLDVNIEVTDEISVFNFDVPQVTFSIDHLGNKSQTVFSSDLAWWSRGGCIFEGGDILPFIEALFEVRYRQDVMRQITDAYVTGPLQDAEHEALVECNSTHCIASFDNRGTDVSVFELAATAMSWQGVKCVASYYNNMDQPPLMIAALAHGTFGMNSLNFRAVASDRIKSILSEVFSSPRMLRTDLVPRPNRGFRFSLIAPGEEIVGLTSSDHWFQISIELELDTRPRGEEIQIRVSEIRQVRYPNDADKIDLSFFSQVQPLNTEDPITSEPTDVGIQVKSFLAHFVVDINKIIDGRIIGLFE